MSNSHSTERPRKGYKGIGLDGALARWYAKNTSKDRQRFRRVADLVARHAVPGSAILEVAPGPGYLALELAALGCYQITGLDISPTFVDIARCNARQAGLDIRFDHGNASQMPYADSSFDFLICMAAFKNFTEPVRALQEMHRVLRPGAKGVIIDLRPNAPWSAITAEVANMNLSWWNSWITKMTFRYLLLQRAYSPAQFRQMAAQTAFKTCEIHEEAIGLNVWLTN